MLAPPKLEPKSLNEWTLEMNISRELCNMFDNPFGIFYPVRIRRIFDVQPFEIARFWHRRAWSEKLTPREEGSGGGWDTKIIIPQGSTADERMVFIQFKCGEHNEGNGIAGSIFNITKRNPNPHIEFSFNNNGNLSKGKPNNQHDALGILNRYLVGQGLSEKSVLYAFPRIKDRQAMVQLTQPLIYYTTFLSLGEMDSEARKNRANLHDGNTHFFRSCYINENRREITSAPFKLSGEDESISFLTEYMMVRLARLWNETIDDIPENSRRDYLTIAVCEELRVDPFDLIEQPFAYFKPPRETFRLIAANRIANEQLVFGSGAEGLTRANSLFKRLHHFIINLRGTVNINSLPANYTSVLPQQSASFDDNIFTDDVVSAVNVARIIF